MHSADACEVLGDALLECGWCTVPNAAKVYNLLFWYGPLEPALELSWEDFGARFAVRPLKHPATARAIAAVLLS